MKPQDNPEIAVDNDVVFETGKCDQCGRVCMLEIPITIYTYANGETNVEYDRPLCKRCAEG